MTQTDSTAGDAGPSFTPDLVTGHVTVSLRGPVARVSFSNGPLNLVTKPLLRDLNQALRYVASRDGVRCLILQGDGGRAFCAGSDINEFKALGADASEGKILFEDMVLRTLARIGMPSIAAIDAPALGGGLELALACDLRVIREGVVIGLTESRLGGLAGSGAARLARLVGPARAKEMLFTGETLDSARALAWGIVNRVTRGPALAGALELAAEICQRGPLSNAFAKQLVDAAHDGPLDAVLSTSTVLQQQIFDSEDLREGVEAFFAKRPPVFKGR